MGVSSAVAPLLLDLPARTPVRLAVAAAASAVLATVFVLNENAFDDGSHHHSECHCHDEERRYGERADHFWLP
jgi:hypothetical protein